MISFGVERDRGLDSKEQGVTEMKLQFKLIHYAQGTLEEFNFFIFKIFFF